MSETTTSPKKRSAAETAARRRPRGSFFPSARDGGPTPFFQAKLSMGRVDDRFEREADAAADRAVAGGSATAGRRTELDEEAMDGARVQASPIGSAPAPAAPAGLGRRIEGARAGARPLPSAVRSEMGTAFGRRFDDVRIHTGEAASGLSRELSARAFTVGRDVFFGAGEYQPASDRGRHLLAHELTHVVQQGHGGEELVQRVATDPVVPVRAQIVLTEGVGSGEGNRVADVDAVQDRLLDLRYLSATDHAAEQPAAGAAGTIPEASLTATTTAIELFQQEVVGMARPDGAVGRGGNTLDHLNRAIPRPTAAERAAVTAALAGIAETVTQGLALTGPVGRVATAAVTAGTANRPADVAALQTRLVQLGYLAAGHTEAPAAGAAASIPAGSLPDTIAALRRFQTREVAWWRNRGTIAGAVTAHVVTPGDATGTLLDRIAQHREVFTTGETVSFRDFVRSRHTRNEHGVSVVGSERPSALPAAEYTALGLTSEQTAALRFVSSHEGNFDALNTYDVARVSFGFIQFAGGRGLPPFMALLKSREPAIFARLFQTFGIDVEFRVRGGDIVDPQVVVVDPAGGGVLRGVAAEEAIRDSARLSAVFIRAGSNTEVQRVQVEAATRDYVLEGLAYRADYEADVVEVLSAPGGNVTATHVGAQARAFRSSPAFATLNAAGRIRERTVASQEPLENLLASEQGLGVLMDRAIQEGTSGGPHRLAGAARWVADQRGLQNLAGVAAHEDEVLQQVIDDFDADADLNTHLRDAIGHIEALDRAARAAGATVAGVLADAAAGRARGELDAAVDVLPRKSFTGTRTRMETQLPTQRTRLDFVPPPATLADLRRLLGEVAAVLRQRRGDLVNSPGFRGRVNDVLTSTLAAPGAPAPAPAPAPAQPAAPQQPGAAQPQAPAPQQAPPQPQNVAPQQPPPGLQEGDAGEPAPGP